MPKPSLHALIWSEEHQHYELLLHGHPEQCFRPGDEPAFSRWLEEHPAFAFVGKSGRISVVKEARQRGTGYWYAYRKQDRHTRKRYLGSSAQVTFARLEEQANRLTSLPPSPALAQGPRGPSSEQKGMLLSTKLSAPRRPIWLVERERLLRDLDAVRSHPLTLVSASAGSGKTTLLSAWLAASCKPQESSGRAQSAERRGAEEVVTWLSLDALDNDPIRFWASVIAALRTGLPTLGEEALALLHSPQSPPLSTILAALLNEIVQGSGEVILILDDFHVISDQAIHDSLLFLLDHLPDTLHLVLATRTDPVLPLSRLRVRGQLLEIRSNDLRFTREEAASFLQHSMGLPLTEEDVAILSERTEGWIAGLQLAALSLRKRQDLSGFVKDFAGSSRFVLDYVQQDILARLPVPLQDFLLQTSILTRMNAALCQAVTAAGGPQESQEMLEEVERANLFVTPLDEQRQWYRFHDLFREALHARLRASQPELAPLLHIRAASFYEAAGELREAITHALAAPDYSFAASLMEQAAPHFWLRGEVRTIHTWVLALPDAVLRMHLRLALGAALRFVDSVNLSNKTLHASTAAQVERTFTRLEGLLHSKPQLSLSEAEVALIRRRLRLLRALIELRALIKRGDTVRLLLLSQEIEALPQDAEVSWNIIPLSIACWLAFVQGEGASLIHRLRQAVQMTMEAGDHLVAVRVMAMLTFFSTHATQLHLAQQQCLEGLALVEQIGVRTLWEGHLYYSLFIVSYACNRLEEASDWLLRLRRSAQDWQPVELLVRGEIFSARLALARVDLPTAHQALHRLEALVEREGFAYYAPWVSTLRVQVWLAEGNLAQASEWAAQTMFSPETWDPLRRLEVLMLVRVFLAQQQYAPAVETLERFSQYFDRPGDIQTAIEWMALYAVALHRSRQREQATRVAARLFAITEPEGYVRLDLDTGEPLMKQVLLLLLEAPQDEDPSAAMTIPRSSVSRLLAAFEQEERRPTQGREASPTTTQGILPHLPQSAVQRVLIEPLSQAEQRVLRLLVAGRTYTEMAEALIVSINTIKTQVSSIYRKLDVSRRAEAIAVTVRLQLL